MTKLVEEKIDDIPINTLVQKNQKILNEKKNQTKEEFEQNTIRTISSCVIKAFQNMPGINIPISKGILSSDPLDPCSSSQLHLSQNNNEIENPFEKMCKFPPIIGSKEAFNYLKKEVPLKENNQNNEIEKSVKQVSSIIKDEDIQSTSSGRSIPPQDPTAGLNQNKLLLDQMVAKMAEKRRELDQEINENSEHSSISKGLSFNNSGKNSNTSPSFSSTSYETSSSNNKQNQKSYIIPSIDEKTSDKTSLHSSKHSNSIKKANSISIKERNDKLFSSSESDDYEDNTSILSFNANKSIVSKTSYEQQKILTQKIQKDDKKINISSNSFSLKNQAFAPTEDIFVQNSKEDGNKSNKDLLDKSFNTSSVSNEIGSVSVKGLIASIGNKIPLHRPDEISKKENQQNTKPIEEEKAYISPEKLDVLKGRAKGPARKAPTNLNVKLQNNITKPSTLNENLSQQNIIKEIEQPPKQQIKELQMLKTSSAISTNNKPSSLPKVKKGLSIFSSSSDDDFDLNFTNTKKSIQEKKENQQQQILIKKPIEIVEEKRNQNNLEKQNKLDLSKQRKGLFDDSDSDF